MSHFLEIYHNSANETRKNIMKSERERNERLGNNSPLNRPKVLITQKQNEIDDFTPILLSPQQSSPINDPTQTHKLMKLRELDKSEILKMLQVDHDSRVEKKTTNQDTDTLNDQNRILDDSPSQSSIINTRTDNRSLVAIYSQMNAQKLVNNNTETDKEQQNSKNKRKPFVINISSQES